jgi:hypothetical protein
MASSYSRDKTLEIAAGRPHRRLAGPENLQGTAGTTVG